MKKIRLPETLHDVVTQFLQMACVHPTDPKHKIGVQRGRENQATVIGYNRAQEDLREMLKLYGIKLLSTDHSLAKGFTKLARVRGKHQMKPLIMGGYKVWTM